MRSYKKYVGSSLAHNVGTDLGTMRVSDGRAGHLIHGPYIEIGPGDFTAGVYIRRIGEIYFQPIMIDACFDHGKTIVAAREVTADDILSDIHGVVELDFRLERRVELFEVRLFVWERVAVEIREVVIFSRSLSDWGG